MIDKKLFGRTGHVSTRTLFGAAALGNVTQMEADRTLELLVAVSTTSTRPQDEEMQTLVAEETLTPLFT